MQGKNFLKVCGILMIIFGAIAMIVNLVAFLGVLALDTLLGGSIIGLTIGALISLVGAVMQFVAGIVGVKNCDKPEKATACVGWGIVVAAFAVIGQIISVLCGGDFSIVSLAIGLVLPVLYIIGGVKNGGSINANFQR